MTTLTAPSKIDELGSLLAAIADLQAKADTIKDAIKEEASLSGQKAFDGDIFKAVYTETNRSTVDWKALAKEISIPADLIAKHTKTAAVYSVKVTSR